MQAMSLLGGTGTEKSPWKRQMQTGYQGTGGDTCLQGAGNLGPRDEEGSSFLEELRKPQTFTHPGLEIWAQAGNLHSVAQLALSMVRLLGGDYNPQHLWCWQSKAETASSWDSGDLSTAAPTPGPLLTQSLPGTCLQLPLAPNTRRVILNASQTCCFTPQMAGSQTLSISPFTLKKKSQNQILLQTARVREQLWLEPHSRRREHTPCHCSTVCHLKDTRDVLPLYPGQSPPQPLHQPAPAPKVPPHWAARAGFSQLKHPEQIIRP